MRKIIFRLDDICPDMNYEKFSTVRDIFLKNNVKPLIGVIPFNKEEIFKLARKESIYVEDEDIWKELKMLQDESGWEIALHGYDHLQKTNDGGILAMNSRSEFAGLPYDLQESNIIAGKKLLESKGFVCKAFMAPGHSFDSNTLKAIRKVGIEIVTDGKGIYPYKTEGCIMMPVPYSIFRNLPFGIYTVCLHSNTMEEDDFCSLRDFIIRNKKNIVSLSEGVALHRRDNNVWRKIENHIMETIMMISIKILLFINNVRRDLR